MPRRSLVIVACSFSGCFFSGCFSPEVSTETEMGGGGTGGSTGTSATFGVTEAGSETGQPDSDTTDIDPDTTATAGNTDTDDAPPVFESFTVNGSTEPPEVDEGGTILLAAEVADDVGVASVEFFDGEVSLAVVDESPFELEVVVSSADSGAHVYSATASDTAGQTTSSEEVSLSINIVGGEVLFYRENLFTGGVGLGGAGVSILSTQTGRAIVTGMIVGTATGRVLAFNEDLSSLWTDNEDALLRAPAVDLGTEVLVPSWLDGEWIYTRRALDSSETTGTLIIDVPVGDPIAGLVGSRAALGGDGVIVSTLPNRLASYTTALVSGGWTLSLPDETTISDLDTLPGGAVVVSFSSTLNGNVECASGFTSCIRRVEPDGSVAWTTGVSAAGPTATRNNGNVVTAFPGSSGGFRYEEFDSNGTELRSQLLEGQEEYAELEDIATDGAGGFVVVGTVGRQAGRSAIVSRYDSNSTLVWTQDDVADGPDSMGLGVSVYEDAAFVCGIENLETTGFSTNGDVFAAKLRL